MDLTTSGLVEIGIDAATAEAANLPSSLRARVLGAAQAEGRPTMHPGWADGRSEVTAHGAFITTAAELCRLLGSLTDEDWARPTQVHGHASVRDLVLHLVGVERYMLGQLGRREPVIAPTPADHFPALRQAAADIEGADSSHVARSWWLAALDLVGATGELGPDQPITYHDLLGGVRGMLVIRTFELWTHDDDIRRAVALPPNPLDDARLSLMSSTLLGVLPYGMARAGTTRRGRTVRIDLTGPGGGTSFLSSLSPEDEPGEPDLVIETTALDLCRVASNRLSIGALDVRVDGDRSLVEPVLVGAGAFAMD
jgi:uncharacterized protein (TIGR03083 family)